MDILKEFFGKEIVKRTLFLMAIGLFIYLIKSVINLFLLTFLFTYLINSAQKNIVRQLKKISPVKEKLITTLLYTVLFLSIVFVVVKYVPIFINEISAFINQKDDFDLGIGSETYENYVSILIQQVDLKNYIKSGVDITLQLAGKIGTMSLHVFIALILSMFFMFEKKKVNSFLTKFKDSKVSGLYKYFSFFGNNFLNTFGKVMQAQIVIALINSLLSVLMLFLMGFPKLVTLWFMIFGLSLIPVAGVIISLIPLSIIAFKIGGITKVVYVLIMIAAIHAMESYFLNPKLMSAKIELPIFFTFIVLIVSEHFLGVWGLLIGIPLFMFLLDLLDVKLT
mgnify:CR=1 FL=1